MGVILANNLKIFQIYMIITKYYISIRVLNMITKLMSIICKDQGEGVVMLKPLNIWNLCAQSSRSRLRQDITMDITFTTVDKSGSWVPGGC